MQYESQELRMNFDEEMQNGMFLHNGPVHRDLNASFGMADSGVASLHSTDQNRPGSSNDQGSNHGNRHTDQQTEPNDRMRNGDSNAVDGQNNRSDYDDNNFNGANANVLANDSKSSSASPVLRLDVDEAPVMTSSPRLGRGDIGSSTSETSVIVFDRERSSSETESATDILDDQHMTPDAYTDASINKEEIKRSNQSLDKSADDTLQKKATQVDYDNLKAENASNETEGDGTRSHNLGEAERDRASTISFDEIGETNDDDEVTYF